MFITGSGVHYGGRAASCFIAPIGILLCLQLRYWITNPYAYD